MPCGNMICECGHCADEHDTDHCYDQMIYLNCEVENCNCKSFMEKS
jgi:hypothetical protein